METRQTNLVAMIAAAVGLILGGLGGYAFHRPATTNVPTVTQAVRTTRDAAALVTNSRADNFRVNLHATMINLAGVVADANFSVIGGQSDSSARQAETSTAIQAIAVLMSGPYGPSARGPIISAWQAQALALGNYATASKTKNTDDKAKAITALRTANTNMAAALQALNSQLPPQATNSTIGQMANALVAADDAFAKGDFGAALSKRNIAQQQGALLGDTIAAATVKALPSKF